jgi:hypothetical protein
MALHMAAFSARAEAVCGAYEKREEPSIKSVSDALDKIATAFDEYKKTNDARIEAIKAGKGTADLDAKLAKMDGTSLAERGQEPAGKARRQAGPARRAGRRRPGEKKRVRPKSPSTSRRWALDPQPHDPSAATRCTAPARS